MTYHHHYILDGHTPVPEPCVLKWAKWMENADRNDGRRVAFTELADCAVSTVFLGANHDFSGEGPPILFETMIFGGEYDEEQWRYSTWDEAEEGHERAVQMIAWGGL